MSSAVWTTFVSAETQSLSAVGKDMVMRRVKGDIRGRSPRGKPMLSRGAGHLSISHTQGCVGLIHDPVHKVGLDISGPEDLTHLRAAAPFFLSPDEALQADTSAYATLQTLWTLKEALAKAIGIGLGLDFPSITFRTVDDRWICDKAPKWRFEVRQLADGYIAAVAVKHPRSKIVWNCEPFQKS